MYRTAHFTETDSVAMVDLMQNFPFAILTGHGDLFPVATHVPILVDVNEHKVVLEGHIMRNTDHYLAFEKNQEVLAIFNGPHTHVSASWYTQPSVGSTWNYLTVHARGRIIFSERTGTINILRRLTDRFEGKDRASSFDNLANDYIEQMVKAIVGFSIEVESMEAVFKLNQNKDIETRENVIRELRKRGMANDVAIALEMENRVLH